MATTATFGPASAAASPTPASSPGPDPAAAPRGRDDLAFVLAARSGDAAAFGELFARWADRVHDLTLRIVRDRDVATDVTQDTFEVAWIRLASLEQPLALGGWLLRIARNRALDRLGRDGRAVSAGDVTGALGVGVEPAVADAAPAAVERAEAAALLWTASAALAPRDASLLDLHLRHGLGAAEIAAELGVAPGTAHQMLHRLRVRLREAVRASVLWERGAPACALLRAELRGEGVTAFDGPAAALIGDHADRCDPCAERRRTRLAPEALFAAAPLLALPATVRVRLADSLTQSGADALGAAAAGPPPPPTAGSGVGPIADTLSSAPRAGRRCRRIVGVIASGAVVVAGLVALLSLPGPGGDAPTVVAVAPAPASSVAPGGEPRDSEPAGAATGPSGSPAGPGSLAPAGAAPQPSSPAPPAPPVAATPPARGTAGGSPEPSVAPDGPVAPDAAPPVGAGSLGEPAEPPSPPPTPPSAERPPAPSPDAPVVVSFTATRVARPGCATPSAAIVVTWRTSGGDVEVRGPGAPGGALVASGTAVACSAGPATYAVVVTGPGGVAEQVATVV